MRSNLLGVDPMCRGKVNHSQELLPLNPEITGLMERERRFISKTRVSLFSWRLVRGWLIQVVPLLLV